MSAFIVDKIHIQAIMDGAMKHGNQYRSNFSWHYQGERHQLETRNADAIGQMLLEENIKSVSYRYSDSSITDLPGRTDAEYIIPFKWQIFGRQYPVVQILKLINCLDYQSCEHPAYKDSEAKCFLDTLKDCLIGDLPGYEEAQWDLLQAVK